MSDLYVNGSSFATGWCEEYEELYFVTPNPSWADYLAELLGSETLYKHGYNGKPPQSTVDHTIEFCEAYKAKHGSLDNLKVCMELTTARYRQWEKIKDKDGNLVQPVSFPSVEDIRELVEYFMIRYMDPETLEEHSKIILREDIPEEELAKYYKEVLWWYPFGPDKMTGIASRKTLWKFLANCQEHLSRGIEYFEENNVDYMFWWINGRTAGTRRTLGSLSKSLGPRLLSNKIFNGTNIVDADPTSFRGHPSNDGHRKIAQGLFEHAAEQNFLGAKNG